MLPPRNFRLSVEARRQVAKVEIAGITAGVHFYRLHFDAYPTHEQGLNVLTNYFETHSFTGAILQRAPVDPWGTPYQYSRLSNQFEIVSAGQDKRFETEDDVMP